MSAEKIIEQIKKDAEQEVKQILSDAEKQAEHLINEVKQQAEKEAESILSDGQKQSENIRKIRVSQAHQEAKRDIMNAREEIIEECFNRAKEKLVSLPDEEYEKIVTQLIKQGSKKIPGSYVLLTTRELDKKIARKQNIPVKGTVNASGGVILQSEDGNLQVDNTFEGILKREKDLIRVKVGKLLFS